MLFFLLFSLTQAKVVVLTPYPRIAATEACAADYDPCGTAVLAPVPNLNCCSASFYCYTRGPYFSQCRPTKEDRKFSRLQQIPKQDPIHAPLCAADNGVCGSGAVPDSKLPCCTERSQCVPASPLYWQCVPGGVTPSGRFWYQIFNTGYQKHAMYSFQDISWAQTWRHRVNIKPVEAWDKISGALHRNGSVKVTGSSVVIATVANGFGEAVLERISDLGKGRVHLDQVIVTTNDVGEVAMTLGAMPEVLRVQIG